MSERDGSRAYSIASVERAFALLDTFNSVPMTLAELSRAAGLSEATTLRYLRTLARHDIVERAEGGRYRLGLGLFRLGQRALGDRDPRKVALPFMEQLLQRFEETVNLAFRNNDDLVIVEVLESKRSIKKGATIGDHDLWHCSSLGKAILASLPEAEVLGILERRGVDRRTARTLATLEELVAELEQVRTLGYAVDNEEAEEGLYCVGTAIFDARGEPRYALSLSGPANRFPRRTVAVIGEELRSVSAVISARLGYMPANEVRTKEVTR